MRQKGGNEVQSIRCLTRDELDHVAGGQAIATSGGGSAVAGAGGAYATSGLGYPGVYGYGYGYPGIYGYGYGYPGIYGYGYPGLGFGRAVAVSGGSIYHGWGW